MPQAVIFVAALARPGPRPTAHALRQVVLDRMSVLYLALMLGPIVALIAGILILAVPRLLNYIVAIYLIVIGLVGPFGSGGLHT
jgi:hypothetical protein